MALWPLVLSAFWPFCTVLCVNRPPNAQITISQLLFVRLTPSLHHSSFRWALRVYLCIVNGFETDRFVCILALLCWCCFVCQSSPKCPNCHILASMVRLTPSLHHSSSRWALQLFLCAVNGFRTAHFGCILALLHYFVCQSSPKCSNCHISASIRPFDPISSPFLI